MVSSEEMQKTMAAIEAEGSSSLRLLTNRSETSVRKLNDEQKAYLKWNTNKTRRAKKQKNRNTLLRFYSTH